MTPDLDPPTLGEVLRRLEEVSRQLSDIVREIKDDRIAASKTYVRQDVYIAERQTANAVVSDLQSDIKRLETKTDQQIGQLVADKKADIAARRQIWLAMAALGVTIVVSVIGFILQMTAR